MTTTPPDRPGVIVRPPFLYGGALAGFLMLRWFWPAAILADGTALICAGIALGAAGVGIAAWGRARMVSARTNVDPAKATTAIVTDGPFRYTRNPLYVGMTLLYVGLALAFNTWWGVALLLPLLAVMHVGVVQREERYLEAKFGDEYRRYKRTVARYIVG